MLVIERNFFPVIYVDGEDNFTRYLNGYGVGICMEPLNRVIKIEEWNWLEKRSGGHIVITNTNIILYEDLNSKMYLVQKFVGEIEKNVREPRVIW